MNVSKAYFNRFKKSFLEWQQKLGLTQYRISFFHERLEGNYASVTIDELGKHAKVSLTTKLSGRDLKVDEGPEAHGKHEAIHLLLYRLVWLGGARYIENNDLQEEWEACVVRLEKLL